MKKDFTELPPDVQAQIRALEGLLALPMDPAFSAMPSMMVCVRLFLPCYTKACTGGFCGITRFSLQNSSP